jgi:hypothetical protein
VDGYCQRAAHFEMMASANDEIDTTFFFDIINNYSSTNE